MKRFGITLLVLMLLLVGCSDIESTQGPMEESSTEPFRRERHTFLSYEDLETWFKSDETGYIAAEGDLNLYGNRYDVFLRQIIQGDILIPKVYLGDEVMIPKCQNGYAPISIWSEDASFYRPWIVYDFLTDKGALIISVSYLNDEELQYANVHTIDEFLHYISPTKEDIEDLNYPWISAVTVEKVKFQQKEVSAIYIKDKYSDHPSSKIFVYDNMCVRVSGVASILETLDWSEFSLRTE